LAIKEYYSHKPQKQNRNISRKQQKKEMGNGQVFVNELAMAVKGLEVSLNLSRDNKLL
jgi:hypothetical protein